MAKLPPGSDIGVVSARAALALRHGARRRRFSLGALLVAAGVGNALWRVTATSDGARTAAK